MTISPGSRLGPYEILAPLGAGGMGEVWRAKDTRLEREVAIKVLPASFAENEQFRARFEREAKTISSLNHPNICTLHDVGHEEGLHYLVMELIEGESLADRLAKGPLPVHEMLRYGSQIADALDRAHRQGIVHRDLKPGNVMLTKSGAKLLDFGLARSATEASPVQGLTEMPTQAKPLTAEGTILGTFQYMAPEQLEGVEADARTDIFALGAVLYEMSTGRRAFAGTTKTSLIAAIVTGQPEAISTIQPVTPPAFEHVVKKCLEKDPDERWQSAHDIASELRWISEAGSQAGVASPLIAKRKRMDVLLRGAVVLLLVAVAALGYLLGAKKAPEDARRLVVDLSPPAGLEFSSLGDFGGPAVLSPDGRMIAFVMDDTGLGGSGRARTNTSSTPDLPGRKIWVRTLSTGELRSLPGTDAAIFPFWAPDSRRIGFATDDTLKWVDVTGGATFEICQNSLMRGGAWAPDDTILFAPGAFDGIYRVPASGGTPVAVTSVDGERYTTHRWPTVLPDGRHFLYLAAKHRDTSRDSGDVWLASLDGGEPRLLLTGTSNAVVAGDSVLFVRQRSLYAQEITDDGELQGQSRLLAENVLFDTGVFGGQISGSTTGRITYHTGGIGSASRALVWIDRRGRVVEEFGEKDLFWDFDLSPDG